MKNRKVSPLRLKTENHMENKKPTGKIITFLNSKGGVAKTTTTISVGAALAAKGYKVLLLDFDPQCSLTKVFGPDPSQVEYTTFDILTNPAKTTKFLKVRENLFMIPSEINMSASDMILSGKYERERLLSKFTERQRPRFDYILVDCPPNLGILAINALLACDHLLVPISPDMMSMDALGVLKNILEMIADIRKIEPTGIIITRYDTRTTQSRDIATAIQMDNGEKVFQTVIRQNVDISKAPTFHKTIFEYNPTSTGAADYLALTEEILSRIQN